MLSTIRNLSAPKYELALTGARTLEKRANAGVLSHISALEAAVELYDKSTQEVEVEIGQLRLQQDQINQALSNCAGTLSDISSYRAKTVSQISKARAFLED